MKKLLLVTLTISFMNIFTVADAQQIKSAHINELLKNLEKDFDGKIGIYAINTNNNQIIAYRANERFPIQSTMKLLTVSALFKKSDHEKNLLQEKMQYQKTDLAFWGPVTRKNVDNGMTIRALAEAAMTYSDTPATNLITKKLGGPESIVNFARSIGNKTYNLERYDGYLNSDPKNNEDTSTPKDMAISLKKLTLGNILTSSQRTQLITWMRNNTVGYKRIRAGVPIGWVVADKTGSGDHGVANDIGILWSPFCKPIVLAIYTASNKKEAERREDILASTTTIVMNAFAKSDSCFKESNN